MALSGAYRETLTRHAVLLKQAETFRARPDDFASLLAERGGIASKDLDAFEDLHARARRHRRAATMRHVHRMKKEAEQEAQHPKPELRQGELALEGGRAEAPRRADTVTRDTAGMQAPDRDAAEARHIDTVPPAEAEDYPWALAAAQEDVPPGIPSPDPDGGRWCHPPNTGLVCALRSLAAGLERTDRESPTNRGAVILCRRIRRHDPAHPGAGGEPGHPGRDTGADDRGARKSPTGSLSAEVC